MTDNYAETFRYDANGNILQLNRNGHSQQAGGVAMDRLTYTYRSGTNQLWSVQDAVASNAYTGDIDNQGGSNYSYDRIGNLIGDVSESIQQVNWTVYGKIGNIRKKQAFLGYVYNAGGERVVKQYLPYATNQCAECPPGTGIDDLEVYERNSNNPETYRARKTITFLSEYTDERYREYSAIIEAGLAQCTPQCNVQPPLNTSDADIYIRDATGNTLAVYHYDRKTGQLRWSEQHLYGSSRLGMYQPEKIVTSVSTDSKQREVGYWGKQIFELSNHLGNVLATITDKKLQVSTNNSSTSYFEAEVQSVQDYYAFGMQMPGRKSSGGYRYGFNGKENDNEINYQDYGFRLYSISGRFISVDPLTKKYPMLSPYQFAGNNPIRYIDLDGLEPANNPKSPGTKEKVAMIEIDLMAAGAAKRDAVENLFSSGSYRTSDIDLKGTYSCTPKGTYLTDTEGDPNNKFNMKVYNGATLHIDESQSEHFSNYEAAVVNRLMRNFITGEGAENYNFPTNGIISSKFLSSDILTNALSDYKNGKLPSNEPTQYTFKGNELKNDFLRNGTLFSITGLAGSGTITMIPNKDGVQIKIFNITSLTSGNITKNPNNDADWPKSYVRDPTKKTPYGNISQTYNLFIPWGSPLLSK
ncbi:MAG: RHS repeat-associated core domain-containing protein [Chitinophagaceae bacterium]|nr:RHS repeat-associated core domain-containing protein [Chitinophagaceae bacterium]MCA6498681.1 RHS repeat-associated core domain-containing protein [Chitinophagaceae bacterium]MCA6513788.1 RHS repeat-associated core domain-containing protein [Chitinophagaceae bacterium]